MQEARDKMTRKGIRFFFHKIYFINYKPNDAFWSLKMEVISAVDKPTE
jgi:hypothetical protein